MDATLRICLFGRVRVSYGDNAPEVKLTPSVQTLFAYLLLQPHRYHSRDVLAELSWGDRPEDQARSCLNTALWRLRRVLEPDGVARGTYLLTMPTGEVGFNWDSNHWLDLSVFERCANCVLATPRHDLQAEQIRQFESVLPLYSGELLEGLYDDWALRERERLRAMHLNSLGRLMSYHKQHADLERSLYYGQTILRHDPLREEIHREMMRLYWANGQRALAVRQYETCRDILAAELNIPPMEETQALYTQITASRHDAVPAVQPSERAIVTPVHRTAPADNRGAVPTTKLSAHPDPFIMQQALAQLSTAMRTFDTARVQLERAIQAVERLGPDA